MKHSQHKALSLMKYLIFISALLMTASTSAIEFPQYPRSVKLIESDTLPIEFIKTECQEINVEENIKKCITNTMNHWTKYRRAVKENPEAVELCYSSLKELDDYILVNNCIEAALEK